MERGRAFTSSIKASGLRDQGTHDVEFDAWQQSVLARTLPRFLTREEIPLSYTGTQSSSAACPSIAPAQMRYLARAGATGSDLRPKSLSIWRADHLLRTTQTLAAALAVFSGTVEHLFNALKYTADESQLHNGVLLARDWDGQTVTQVPAREYHPNNQAA